MRRLLALALAAAVGLAPLSAPTDPLKPSKADQVKLGKRARDEVREKEKVVATNDERVRLVRRVGRKVLDQMDLSKEPWEFSFDVIDNKQINAFALPGGPIFFFSGLLENMRTEDEVAAVMAHEIAHVTREHWAYSYRDYQQKQLGLTLLFIVLRPSKTVMDLASIGSDLILTLPYSRRHESEADTIGLKTMVSAGYNPQAMIDVFEMMAKKAGGGRPPEFLSSHPQEASRTKKIQGEIGAMNKTWGEQKPLPWIARAKMTLREG